MSSEEVTDLEEILLTVAIPTYNGAATIGRMLDILLAQADPRVEIVISDNASTDKTPEIVATYLKRYPSVRYIRQASNQGPDSNFLACYELARGRFTFLLSDDDVLMEGKLPLILDFLENHADISLLYLNAKGFYENYTGEGQCHEYDRAVYDRRCFVTEDKREFMRYAGRMWGFLSCFICRTEAVREIPEISRYKGTNWLQAYIHICSAGYNGRLGVISYPCIGAGIYGSVQNYDAVRVLVINFRKMLDFAIDNGFDKKQMDQLYIWMVCFMCKRAVIKERAAGLCLTNPVQVVRHTYRYPVMWVKLYPFLILPKWLCRLAVSVNNRRRKYTKSGEVNRKGDVIG